MDRKIRVLYCLAYASQANGVVTFVRNYLSKIYDKIDASVVCGDNDLSQAFVDFCKQRNITLYLLPNSYDNGSLKYISSIKHFFKDHHDFDIVHCNIPNYGMFYLKAAKKWGIKIRIVHSHSSNVAHRFPMNLIEKFMERRTVSFATDFIACSKEAGEYLFGKKNFEIIPNCVDYSAYKFNLEKRLETRHRLNIPENSFVLLFVGRLAKEKNPGYALETFKFIHDKFPKSYLLYVGSGDLESELRYKGKSYGIGDSIKYIGSVDDTALYYSAADALIIPSLFEGLPLVAVESQCSGLPIFCSEGVPCTVNISNLFHTLSLKDRPKIWAKEILAEGANDAINRSDDKLDNLFNLNSHSLQLFNIYCDLMRRS